jgi:hypothetical protein
MMSHAAIRPKPAPRARAVHGGDDRYGAFADAVRVFTRGAIVPGVVAGRLDDAAALLDIRARAEHLAGSGEYRHAHVVAIVERIEHLHDLVRNCAFCALTGGRSITTVAI